MISFGTLKVELGSRAVKEPRVDLEFGGGLDDLPIMMTRLCDVGASWVGGWLSLRVIVEGDITLKVGANIQSSRSSKK